MKKLIFLFLFISGIFSSQVQLLNSNSKQIYTYTKVEKYFDGTSMTDQKVDNYIYFKRDGYYYALNDFLIGEPLNIKLFGVYPDDL